jgi:entericidin B
VAPVRAIDRASKSGALRPFKETDMTRLIAVTLAAALAAMLSACNTVEGAGKDVKATGQAVENAADKSKPH